MWRLLLVFAAAVTAATAAATTESSVVAALRTRVRTLEDENQRLLAEVARCTRGVPLPPATNRTSLLSRDPAALSFLWRDSSSAVDVYKTRHDPPQGHLPGFARYPAETSESPAQEASEPKAMATTASKPARQPAVQRRRGNSLQDSPRALCYFYTKSQQCRDDFFCNWVKESNGEERCKEKVMTCNKDAKEQSQCIGPNAELREDCAWECKCEKKTQSTDAGGHDSLASRLCSCPQSDNPNHIHSKDTCKMKKFYYKDGSVDETCYIEQTCGHNGHSGHDPPYNILFISASFGVGAFCRYWAPRLPGLRVFPYTVLMFLIGTGFGFMTNLGYPLSNYQNFAEMNPHEIFFIFLPILIFESAFATDYHVFKKVIVGCLLLAGPGIMVAAFLTGALAKIAFTEYDWSWVTCFLFGTVLSATDPVAVVALLKELGASPEISTMIEGESLFNDGTAIALFGILKDAVPTGTISKTALEMFLDFCKIAIGGPAVGLVVGFLAKLSLSAVFNDALVEVTVTVFCAYTTFFVAEGFLQVSGVLGLVAFGCFLSYHRACISPEVEHTLHHFWELTVYMTNTLIFSLSGLIVSQKAFKGITPIDYLYLLITYVGINVIRGFCVMCFMPILRQLPYKLDFANAVLVTWGGLRGAVGLALGLIVAGDAAILCSHPQLGSRFLFHCSGIVVLTLLVNGVTTKLVVQKLHLDRMPDLKLKDMEKAYQDLMKHQEKHLRGLMRQPVLADTNWRVAKEYAMRNIKNPYTQVMKEEPHDSVEKAEAYIKLIKQAVMHEYEEGNVGGKSARKLVALCQSCSEQGRVLQARDLEELFHISTAWRWSMHATRLFPLANAKVEQRARESLWAHAFDVSIAFVNAHEACIANIANLLPRKLANDVTRHCKVEIIEAMKLLEWYTRELPEIAVAIKTRHASRHILNTSRQFCHHMQHKGMIDEEDVGALVDEVEQQMKRLRYLPNVLTPSDLTAVLKDQHGNWFSKRGAQLHMAQGYTIEKFQKGKQIGEKGLENFGFYAITLGVVRVHIQGKAQYFGPGFCVNLLPALTGRLDTSVVRFSECFAETAVVAAFFPATLTTEACLCEQTKHALWTQLGKQLSENILSTVRPYSGWEPEKLREMCHVAQLHEVTPDRSTRHVLSSGNVNILINGRCCEVPKSESHLPEILKEPMKLDEITARNCLFWDDAVLVTVRDTLGSQEKARQLWGKLRSWMITVRKIAALIGPEAVHDSLALALRVPVASRKAKDAVKKSDEWQREFDLQILRRRDKLDSISPTSPMAVVRRNAARGFGEAADANRSQMVDGSFKSNPLAAEQQRRAKEQKEKEQKEDRKDRERQRRQRDKDKRRTIRETKAERERMIEEAEAEAEAEAVWMPSPFFLIFLIFHRLPRRHITTATTTQSTSGSPSPVYSSPTHSAFSQHRPLGMQTLTCACTHTPHHTAVPAGSAPAMYHVPGPADTESYSPTYFPSLASHASPSHASPFPVVHPYPAQPPYPPTSPPVGSHAMYEQLRAHPPASQ